MKLPRYHWLLGSFLFTLVHCSPGYPRNNNVAASHGDILGNEARIRQDSCGSTDNSGGCSPGERNDSCTYECRLLHEPPPEYNSSCEFIEANCADEYELLNYLQFMECHLGPSVRVCTHLKQFNKFPELFCLTLMLVATWIHYVGTVVALSLISTIYNGQYLMSC